MSRIVFFSGILMLGVVLLPVSKTFGQTSMAARTPADVDRMHRLLQAHIDQCGRALQSLEGRMPPLADELRQLIEQVEQTPPSRPDDRPPETEEPRQVRDRPPIRRTTRKQQVPLVCLEGRVNHCPDAMALNQHALDVLDRNPAADAAGKPIAFDVPGFNLRFEIRTERSPERISRRLFVGNQPGRLEGTWQQIERPGSPLRRLLASGNPQKQYITFLVWPDSYHVFHEARALAWEAGYDVGWELMKSGDALPFGGGPGTTQ